MVNKRVIRDAVFTVAPNMGIAYFRRIEKKKFQDPRRVAIANQYPLTKEQKEQIDDLFVRNYGEKIDYVWHQNYAAHAGKFDYRFFPELLYIPEFEAFQNQNRHAVAMMGDKNMLPLIAKAVGVRMPHTLVSCANGVLRDAENRNITAQQAQEIVEKAGDCFVKPSVETGSGKGCLKIKDGDETKFGLKSLRIGNGGGYNSDFVVQNLVTCHESIRSIYAGSVNTFRVMTYLWRGDILVKPVIIRIGRGGNYLDNAHAGGMFCAVNEDGTMGNHAVTEFNEQYTEHPDTHVVFANHRIKHLDKVIEAAKRMHAAVPQVGLFNWDFTIDETGEPVLIEANCDGCSIWLSQMAHGVGAFGDKTAEVLQWLRFMKGMKTQNRKHFVGGYME